MDLRGARWRKSTRSADDQNANCIEIALVDQGTAIRDSKNPSPAILIPQTAWSKLRGTLL